MFPLQLSADRAHYDRGNTCSICATHPWGYMLFTTDPLSDHLHPTQLVYERRAMLCIISYYRIVKELRPKLRLAAQRCLPSRSRFHLPLRPLNKQMKDWCFKQHQARTDMLSKRSFAQQINPRRICCTTFQAQHFRPGLIRCATNQAWPDLLRNKSGQTQPDGWRSWEKQGFFYVFCLIFALFFAFCPFVYT